MKEDLLLIGAGGHAQSVINIIQSRNEYNILGIIDNEKDKTELMGIPIIGCDDDLVYFYNKGIHNAFITVGSIGNILVRKKLFCFVKKIGFFIPNLIDVSAHIENAELRGEGILISKNSILNAGVTVHTMSIINTGALIEHDCIIGEYVHISPGAVLCGGVTIGKGTHVGANATIIQNLTIGEDVMIGAGSVIIADVLNNQRMAGNPAHLIH